MPRCCRPSTRRPTSARSTRATFSRSAGSCPSSSNVDYKGVRSLPIPVFMFMGRHDYTTPSQPTADWLARVSAPAKQGVWFERSSHMIPWEEPGKMLMSLVQYVRPLADERASTASTIRMSFARSAFSSRSPCTSARRQRHSASTTSPSWRSSRRDSRIAAPARKAPAQLQALNYDQYRDIRFRPDRALWRADKLPFELMFFHLGKFQKDAVRIDEVTPQGTRHIPYRASDFDFGKNKLSPQSWGDLGFGGFRAHYPLNDERVQGRGRGVPRRELLPRARRRPALRLVGARPRDRHRRRPGRGISRASPSSGSSSPRRMRTTLTLYALLDSPRATRRLSVRRASRRRDGHGRARAHLPARRRRDARHRAAHQHVLLRREPAASHGLPPGGARLRRPDGRHRRRRVDLAAAAQSAADADDVVLDARSCAASG